MKRCQLAVLIAATAMACAIRGAEADHHLASVLVKRLPMPAPAAPAVQESAPLPANDTPEGAVVRMMTAYAGQRLDAYAGMLTTDYTFMSPDPDFVAAFPHGSSRSDEIRMADHLFHGFTDAAGTHHPRVAAIHLDTGPLAIAGTRDTLADAAATFAAFLRAARARAMASKTTLFVHCSPGFIASGARSDYHLHTSNGVGEAGSLPAGIHYNWIRGSCSYFTYTPVGWMVPEGTEAAVFEDLSGRISIVTADFYGAVSVTTDPDPRIPSQVRVDAPGMRMAMTFDHGERWEMGSAGYAFWVVRGDSALLGSGAGDPSRWYVRRCIESPQPATLASASPPKSPASPAPADSANSDAVQDLHGPLAILRMPNPARFAIELEFRVPGEGLANIDLFDVSGRRVLRREVDDHGAGVHRLFLTDGNRVRPGVYWVRIGHGRQTVTRKVVLVP